MINQRAAGRSVAEIGAATGYTPGQVQKHIERPKNVELIAKEKERLMAALPDVVQDQINNVKASAKLKIDVEDENFHRVIKVKGLGLKSGEIILKASGILPTAAFQSPNIPTQINVSEIRNIIYNQMTAPDSDKSEAPDIIELLAPSEDKGDNKSNADNEGK
jgi:hypothetical protein